MLENYPRGRLSEQQQQQRQDTENPLVAFRSYHARVSLEEPESCAFHSATKPVDELYSMTPDAGDILFRHRPHDCNFEVNGQTLTLTPIQQECGTTSVFPASTNTVFFTHARPLSSTERQAIYEALSDSLGPPCGIEECVGTYRRHMQDRSRLYYESAHPVDIPLLPADLNRTPTPETNDFRFWLSSGEILGSEHVYPTRVKHDIQKMVMKQCEDRLSHECCVLIGSDQPFMQTLDDLFPTPPTDTRHVMESPVIRSGQFAVALPFYTLVPEVERKLPGEDGQMVEDRIRYYAKYLSFRHAQQSTNHMNSNILGFTSVTNQQNANIRLKAMEAESVQSVPMSLAPYANDHSNALSNASRGISSTSRCHARRKGRLDRTAWYANQVNYVPRRVKKASYSIRRAAAYNFF
ncbi:hypothetical protein EDD15DRAFT_283566 [Pisolithus albus]|nr:hypothetical protein EDD15DRAFT_283566 [Pisolithus albus]